MRRIGNNPLKTFATVAHADRLAILRFLEGGERSVGDIARDRRLEQSVVSHHLRQLADCGLVRVRKDGAYRFYSAVSHRTGRVLKVADDLAGMAVSATRELGRTKEKFDLLIGMSPIGIAMLRRGRFVFMNQSGLKMLGYERQEQIIGKHVIDFALPGHKASATRVWQKVRADKLKEPARYPLYRDDGRFVCVEIEARPLSVGGVEVMALFRDITGSLKAEDDLRQSEERFRKVFDDSQLGMVLTDLKCRVLRLNRKFCSMLGYAEEELLNKDCFGVTHPAHLAADRRGLDSLLSGKLHVYRTEKRYVAKSGAVVWTITFVSLVRDGAGRPLHFQTMVEDITDRKAIEAALHRNEKRTQAALTSAHVVAWRYEKATGYFDAQGDVSGLLGFVPKSMDDFLSHMNKEDVAAVLAAAKEKSVRGGAFVGRMRFLPRPGKRDRWVEAHCFVSDTGVGKYVMEGVLFDVTATVEQEAKLKASEERLTRVIGGGPTMVLVVDVAGRVISVGNTGHLASGPAIIGRAVWEIPPSEYRCAVRRVFKSSCASGRPCVVDGLDDDGRRYVCHVVPLDKVGACGAKAIVTIIVS